jgi:multicomponent Na+:H+ antiporter subunit G
MIAALEVMRLSAAAALVAGGLGFMALAALGALRLPDPLSRLHAVTKAETAGLALFLAGVVLCAPSLRLALLALGAWGALAISAASASHFIARRILQTQGEDRPWPR